MKKIWILLVILIILILLCTVCNTYKISTSIKMDALKKQKKIQEQKKVEETRKIQEQKKVEETRKIQEQNKLEEQKHKAKLDFINNLKVDNIEFNVNKSSLKVSGKNTITKLYNLLIDYPDVKINLSGHTDSDGSDIYNLKLSQKRASSVQKLLIKEGFNKLQFKTIKSYGESKPLVPNTTDENKQRNRRVEINITGE